MANLSKTPNDLQWLANQSIHVLGTKMIDAQLPTKEPKTGWEICKKLVGHALAFLGGAMSGIMIARIATVAGTAIFLPFAVAALANPYTIGIMVICGLAYGTFMACHAYQKRKETKAEALFKERQEKVFCLQEQVKLADLQIQLLEAKRVSLSQGGAVAPVPAVGAQKKYSMDDIAVVSSRQSMFHRKTSMTLEDYFRNDQPRAAASH